MASTASEWVLKSTLASPVGLPLGANSNSTLTGDNGEKNYKTNNWLNKGILRKLHISKKQRKTSWVCFSSRVFQYLPLLTDLGDRAVQE